MTILLIPGVLLALAWLFIFALCVAARRGDDMMQQAAELPDERSAA